MNTPPSNLYFNERERVRITDLLGILPTSGATLLDVGARSGVLSRLAADRFDRVVALDLEAPKIADDRIECVKGDATSLTFPDESFDVVVCSEVLEHIPNEKLALACNELSRVARLSLVIGVPYREDLRCARTICVACGRRNPPWGHVNSFDEKKLFSLFPRWTSTRVSYVGSTREATNSLSSALMNFAGNPYGTYDQLEHCIHCGAALVSPRSQTLPQKVAARAAVLIDQVQQRLVSPRASWIHVNFARTKT